MKIIEGKDLVNMKFVKTEGSSCYEADMNKVVSCASCGKKILYGNGYTSHRIHTNMGFGYAVCERCYFDREM